MGIGLTTPQFLLLDIHTSVKQANESGNAAIYSRPCRMRTDQSAPTYQRVLGADLLQILRLHEQQIAEGVQRVEQPGDEWAQRLRTLPVLVQVADLHHRACEHKTERSLYKNLKSAWFWRTCGVVLELQHVVVDDAVQPDAELLQDGRRVVAVQVQLHQVDRLRRVLNHRLARLIREATFSPADKLVACTIRKRRYFS